MSPTVNPMACRQASNQSVAKHADAEEAWQEKQQTLDRQTEPKTA